MEAVTSNSKEYSIQTHLYVMFSVPANAHATSIESAMHTNPANAICSARVEMWFSNEEKRRCKLRPYEAQIAG